MKNTAFAIPSFTSMNDAAQLLFDGVVARICPQANVGRTMNGVVLTLHNKGIRPTVYHAEVHIDKFGKASHIVLDTIIAENKVHECLKVNFPVKSAVHIVNLLERLSAQPHSGTKEETLSNYQALGLFYRKLSDEEGSAR